MFQFLGFLRNIYSFIIIVNRSSVIDTVAVANLLIQKHSIGHVGAGQSLKLYLYAPTKRKYFTTLTDL